MPENEYRLAHGQGSSQFLEADGTQSALPPPLQLFASAADPPVENGGGDFPWIGMVRTDAWSSGFYASPDHARKTADLPKGTKVRATARRGGWIEVEILSGAHRGECGYISQERLENLEARSGTPHAEPYAAELSPGTEIAPGTERIPLAGDGKDALFYAREGDRIFVVPADKVSLGPDPGEVEYESLVHSFQDRGASGFTTLYVTYPGEDNYAPIQWYAEASQGGLIDIWGALLAEFAQLIEQMDPPKWAAGKQHPNFYIGNEAHRAIAEYYRSIHSGSEVFTNSTPIVSILEEYKKLGIVPRYDNLDSTELLARPDITNINLHNLFEIKPWKSAAKASTEVIDYHRIFLKAGIPMQLGPMYDPGAKGAIPMPDGYAVFYSPEPGVILYKYKKKGRTKVPQEVPKTYTAPYAEPDGIPQPRFVPPIINPFPDYAPSEKSIWDWEYWEEVTGLTGVALLIYLILSEGSRLFPPRNAIPIP